MDLNFSIRVEVIPEGKISLKNLRENNKNVHLPANINIFPNTTKGNYEIQNIVRLNILRLQVS